MSLELPIEFAVVYLVFGISLLKNSVGDPTFIVPSESVDVMANLTIEEVCGWSRIRTNIRQCGCEI